MSILIRGMDMPRTCHECWIPCEVPVEDRNYLSRSNNCPAILVPPHGRLIDADAFAAELEKREEAAEWWRDGTKEFGDWGTQTYHRADAYFGAVCDIEKALDKMPTIIKAEEDT